MSGSQVGTVVGGVVGAVVGFYAGNPIMGAQLGMAVGGTIGGAIDPTKVNGPHIGDGQSQSATDGQPIAWVMGTATVAGTIVQVSQRREVKIKDSGGKGGGPVVSHYDAVQDFAILICESSELRGSTIASVLMVEQDGKIVYDVRPESTILNDSFKWKANVDFLFGGEDQLPHPTLEAITGIGNTPSYRGSCLAVFKNFDVTLVGGRIPSFKFTVTSSATSTPVVVFGLNEPIKYKYVAGADGDNQELMGLDYSSPSYDDSEWPVGGGTVGNTYYGDGPVFTYVPLAPLQDAVWVRKAFDAPLLTELHFMLSADDWCKVWLNGTLIHADVPGTGRSWHAALRVDIPMRLIQPHNLVAVKLVDDHGGGQVAVALEGTSTTLNGVSLAAAVTAICVRGDLTPEEIDVTDLAGIPVLGYTVARDTTAADDLAPLLQAHFAYAAEYDGQLHFHLYGADALVTVAEDDLLEANDANDDNVVSTVRNQATEFPRKIVASYIDPAQNYMPVNVMAERLAVDVTAVGVQSMGIPVVMTADQARQAVGKALKIAYATLEGTQEYSVPFARTATYLSLVAGDAVIFRGKRWVLDEVTLSNGFLKLAARRDRQSAYTSNVQAIVGNVPTPPASPYSGPTTLIPMNLPQLRPQDTSGLYLAAASTTGSPAWRGAQVQASYDGQVSWQNAVAINEGSTMGSVALPVPPGGQPLTVNTGGTGNLETVTAAQLAARANAFAFVSGDTAEIGQFQTATEDSEIADRYALTDVTRGLLGTTQVPAVAGQVWTMLDSVYFLPIGVALAGTTIYLRAVGFGEVAEYAAVVSITYRPQGSAGNPVAPDGGTIFDGGGDVEGGQKLVPFTNVAYTTATFMVPEPGDPSAVLAPYNPEFYGGAMYAYTVFTTTTTADSAFRKYNPSDNYSRYVNSTIDLPDALVFWTERIGTDIFALIVRSVVHPTNPPTTNALVKVPLGAIDSGDSSALVTYDTETVEARAMCVLGGHLWFTTLLGRITEVDPSTMLKVKDVTFAGACGITTDGTSLFVATYETNVYTGRPHVMPAVACVNPDTGATVWSQGFTDYAVDLKYAVGKVWCIGTYAVTILDASDGSVLKTIKTSAALDGIGLLPAAISPGKDSIRFNGAYIVMPAVRTPNHLDVTDYYDPASFEIVKTYAVMTGGAVTGANWIKAENGADLVGAFAHVLREVPV